MFLWIISVEQVSSSLCPLLASTDILRQHQESRTPEEVLPLPNTRLNPPRLLICYSSNDGSAHIKAVMQLAVYIQRHMATQVNEPALFILRSVLT